MSALVTVSFREGAIDTRAFDRPIATAAEKVLVDFAERVVATARASITDSSAPSRPGDPPHSHTGALREGIDYVYDPDTQSVIIGAGKLSGQAADVPAILEVGGQSRITYRRGRYFRTRSITIAPRPYITPAYNAELQQLPPHWQDTIRN